VKTGKQLTLCASIALLFLQPLSARAEPAFSWRRTEGSLALLNQGRVVWRFNFDKKDGKPYFHPVCLADGTELTWHRPPDHPWHYGLWFSWKFINGLNYWEEDPKTGLSQGRTEIESVKTEPHDDYSADIVMRLGYHPPAQPTVVTERCRLHVSRPDENGWYRIDWSSEFSAGGKDVLFDRTPISGEKDGKSWGGYAGLSVRLAKDISGWQVIDSESRKDLNIHGQKARWLNFSGTAANKTAGIAIFDHPGNLRHPSPCFVIMDPKMPFGYFSPALLFNEPYTLPAGKSLTLRYRVLIHPGRISKELLEREWKSFSLSDDVRIPAQSDRQVQTRLDKPAHVFRFRRDMPFGEAVEQIKYCVEPPLPIAVLWKDLYDNADIDRTTPAGMDEISGISPGTALKLLLMAVSGSADELGYAVQDGVIIIATTESLPKLLKTRVYDISDLF